MEHLRKDIREDFEYSRRQYNPAVDCNGGLLSEYEIMKAHYILSDYFLSEGESVRFGIHDFGLLSSAVSRQCVAFGGKEKWNTPIHKIATLVFGLVKDHAFNDGNKRTALLSMLLALNKNKRQANCKKEIFETLLVRIAANKLSDYSEFKKFNGPDAEVEFIADFIRRKTRKVDASTHSLTYEEFNTKLRKYNVWLGDPDGNYINVYQAKPTKKTIFGKQKSQNDRKLQIGFQGWKKQINPKAMKEVLKVTGLTPANGIDSRVFYFDAAPEYKLIEEYYPVLKRLKDK